MEYHDRKFFRKRGFSIMMSNIYVCIISYVFDWRVCIMDKAEQARWLFEQGIQAKREGRYEKALEFEKEGIRIFPDNPRIMQAYYAMGKVHYLNKSYFSAMQCYLVYCNLCIIKNPAILSDYRAFKNGDEVAKYNLIPVFENLAKHVGYSLIAHKKNDEHRFAKWYRLEIAGQDPDNMPDMMSERQNAISYTEHAIEIGYSVIFTWFDEFLKDSKEACDTTSVFMASLVNN